MRQVAHAPDSFVMSFCLCIATLQAGCADDVSSEPEADASVETMQAQKPVAAGRGLAALWGAGPDDLWSVGELGTILHYDGISWRAVESGTTRYLLGVYGCAADDVWAVGDGIVLRWDGERWSTVLKDDAMLLLDVWCGAEDHVWVGGAFGETDLGLLGHWDGARWLWAQADGTWTFWALWGSEPNDVWAGGSKTGGAGHLARGDVSSFAAVDYPGSSPRGIWGSSGADVWVIPYTGAFQRWNGSSWTEVTNAVASAMTDVNGTGPEDAWAVGLDGVIAHWDGEVWTQTPVDTHKNLSSVWALAADDAWVAGQDGTLLHWDGMRWNAGTGDE